MCCARFQTDSMIAESYLGLTWTSDVQYIVLSAHPACHSADFNDDGEPH